MKLKPVVLVIVTLAIGFFLGMLTSAQLRSNRLKPVKMFFSEEKFREAMYNAIQPTDDQKVKIEAVLNKYSRINTQATSSFRKEFETRMETFRSEIDSILTPDQIARMKELDAQRQKMIKERRNQYDRDFHNRDRHDSIDHASDDRPLTPPPPPGN
jgi:Spy/CpxP family protein refolding chaperone